MLRDSESLIATTLLRFQMI